MLKKHFLTRSQPSGSMNLAPPQNQLAPAPSQLEELGQFLRESLQQRSPWLQLQVQCAVKQSTLLVLIEHLLHIEPDPKLTFLDLEEALFDRSQELLRSGFIKSIVGDSQALPVRAYMRISGYQQPYATDSFTVEPEPAEIAASAAAAEETAVPEIALDTATSELSTVEISEPIAPEPIAPVLTQPIGLEEPIAAEPVLEERAIESFEPDPTPEVAEPKIAEPEVAEPEILPAAIAEPEIAEPEILSAAIAEPEIAEPEIAEPEATEFYTAPELETPVEDSPSAQAPESTTSEPTLSEIEAALLELEVSPSDLQQVESISPEAIEPAIATDTIIESPWVDSSPNIPAIEPIETESEPIAAAYFSETDTESESIADISTAEPIVEVLPIENTELASAPLLDQPVESEAVESEAIAIAAIPAIEPNQVNLVEPVLERSGLENPFALLDEAESIAEVSPIDPNEVEPESGLPIESDSIAPDAIKPAPPTPPPLIELPDSYLADSTDLPANSLPVTHTDSIAIESVVIESVAIPPSAPSVSEPELPHEPPAEPPAVESPVTEPDAIESPTTIVQLSETLPLPKERKVIAVEELVQPPPPRSRWSASSTMLASSVGLFAIVSSAYVLTRPCVLGSTCEPLQKAQQLDQQASQTIASTDSALKVAEAYTQLDQARHLLDTIPEWSSQYQTAQALRSTYSTKADVVGGVVRALKQANFAAQKSQNPPHPLQDWRKIQLTWREAIALLEKVPPDSPVAALAQKKLKEYQANLSQTDARVITEQDAQDKVATARNTAQVAETRAGLASSPESWQQVYLTWEAAIALLLRIPDGTMAQVEAKHLIPIYQAKMDTASQRRLQEVSSTGSLQEAISAADQARSLEQQNQWQKAIEAWQRALDTVQKIPQDTSYYLQAQALVGEYQAALTQATESQRRLNAMQEIKPDLDRTCGETPRVCTYTLSPEAIRVQITAEYDQLVESHINNSQLRGNYSARTEVVNQVNKLLQQLSSLSETAKVPIELYNSNGSKFGTYTPNPSGGASSITGAQ